MLDQRGPEVSVLCGGTNFLVDYRAGEISPKRVVDIFGLKELSFIEEDRDTLRIGSATTMKTLAASTVLRQAVSFLAEAARQVGSPQVRNRATLGGNILSASPAADTLPPLLTLEATLTLNSLKGEREVLLASFLKGPKSTDLRPNEILREIRFKKPGPTARNRFVKFGRRKALAISVINMALLLSLGNESRKVTEARIAVGAVAPTTIRIGQAEKFLMGNILNDETIRQAAEMTAQQCQPISDIRGTAQGRRLLVKAWLEKILSELADR